MDIKHDTFYIGDISQSLGLSQRTIRYYEELGLIHPQRTEGGFRIYSKCDVDTIRMILSFKDLGMALEDIREIFAPTGGLSVESISRLRSQLASKRREFDSKIKEYNYGIKQIDMVLKILSRCIKCGRPSEVGVCGECLKRRGKDSSPLIATLLSREEMGEEA